MEDIYLRTDELNEGVRALELAADMLPKVSADVYYWKWVIVAVHDALQCFMVCALKGSAGLDVLRDDVAEKWLEAYRSRSEEFPKEFLDYFLNLYEKIKGPRMLKFVEGKQFVPHGQQDWSVKKLHSLRNDFLHFKPMQWSLNVNGLPQIVDDCIAIIEFLAFESGNILYTEDDVQSNTRKSIDRVRNETGKLQELYSG